MKVLALLAFGSLVLSCGGGGGVATTIPEAEACGQITKTACLKVFDPACSADTASLLVQMGLKSEADCETTVVQGYCASAQAVCPTGYTYHGDKAQTCKDTLARQPCTTFNQTLLTAFLGGSAEGAIASLTVTFPVCSEVCTAP